MAEASSGPPLKKLKLESDAGESEENSSSGARDEAQAFGSCDSKDLSCDSQGKKIDSTHTKEEDVGITEYVSPQPGFFAILKRRLGIPSCLAKIVYTLSNLILEVKSWVQLVFV